MKITRSFRLPQELLDKAERLGLNLNHTVEAAVQTAVGERRCPTCGQKLKEKRKAG